MLTDTASYVNNSTSALPSHACTNNCTCQLQHMPAAFLLLPTCLHMLTDTVPPFTSITQPAGLLLLSPNGHAQTLAHATGSAAAPPRPPPCGSPALALKLLPSFHLSPWPWSQLCVLLEVGAEVCPQPPREPHPADVDHEPAPVGNCTFWRRRARLRTSPTAASSRTGLRHHGF
jgi:hypothetical protein